MERSARRIREGPHDAEGPRESCARTRTASRGGVPRAVEGIAVLDRHGENAGHRSGCRAALRAVTGLPLREKGSGDVFGAEHSGAELSGKQMERRWADGGGELPLGGTRTRKSCFRVPARPGYLSERKICVQLRM